MRVYPEFKKIAGACEKIRKLGETLSAKFDIDGLNLFKARPCLDARKRTGICIKTGVVWTTVACRKANTIANSTPVIAITITTERFISKQTCLGSSFRFRLRREGR